MLSGRGEATARPQCPESRREGGTWNARAEGPRAEGKGKSEGPKSGGMEMSRVLFGRRGERGGSSNPENLHCGREEMGEQKG